MPFFSRHTEPEEEAVPVETHRPIEEERPKRGLFGSMRRDPSPTPTTSTNSTRFTSSTYHTTPTNDHSSGLFRRSTDAGSSRRSGLLHKFGNGSEEMDPSIVQARERVLSAEAAEREADRVLDIARREVREARDQVRKLELEAKEEARRAKIKQFHAKEVSKRGKALGRHDV
ncbi:hypothetical protein UCRPA7_4805 [Phaeoacremonium minimum UCRPA7]|uniref:Uncharacterized protein n=1 Tax=Phaeoacremonium minimum (strain UCR-PA7) TaxID=1286976 RepID=R8BJZ1_PHAM7|nr:hypothetical protein UCRPA7_4805 [Phaeoacremonium minimum UCRPA7]EON99631.1 hypothetical protein UCRPA7_4805 [Phaeoacremonium minimum UCRPA7]